MPKNSFFVASDVLAIMFNRISICKGDKFFWKRLAKSETLEKEYWDCKLEHLKIVRNRHQHIKTSKD